MSEAHDVGKRWLATAVIVAGLAGVILTKEGPRSSDTATVAARTEARGTAAERAMAAAEGRPVFLCFRSGVTMAGNCLPCREMARITAELGPKYGHRVAFVDVSLDDDTDEWGLIERYQVRVKPTNVLLDRTRKVVEQRLGVWPAAELAARLEQVSR